VADLDPDLGALIEDTLTARYRELMCAAVDHLVGDLDNWQPRGILDALDHRRCDHPFNVAMRERPALDRRERAEKFTAFYGLNTSPPPADAFDATNACALIRAAADRR
jgi:hypothetical protein